MALDLNKIFPDHANWPFIERGTGASLTLVLSSRPQPGRRHLDLNDPVAHPTEAFFDRMAITDAGLELNRIRLLHQTLDIRPPFTITTGEQLDHVPNLFPGLSGTFPMATPPYDGSVVSKRYSEKPAPGSPQPDFLWEVHIASRAREGTKVLDATFQFTQSGLLSYVGEVYGVFFIYQRSDIGVRPPVPHP